MSNFEQEYQETDKKSMSAFERSYRLLQDLTLGQASRQALKELDKSAFEFIWRGAIIWERGRIADELRKDLINDIRENQNEQR